jgi:NCS1 family nucleobase:cation symporter-1
VNPDEGLINEDFKPTEASKRTFGAYDISALWIGLVICVPAYCLAGGLVDLGMSWWQGLMTIFVSNAIVLVPMVLNAHSGTKYGVPFPVLTRAAFGIRGANVVGVLRGLVACVWFGIQTYFGGAALMKIYECVCGKIVGAAPLPFLGGITGPDFTFFMIFWLIQVLVLVKGMESIRIVEKYSAPILIGLSVALFYWAFVNANGLAPMLSATSQFGPGGPKEGQFLKVFLPSVTANVGFWSTLALNIPDFTRYAKSQKAQLTGQAIGLPIFMALFSFLGLAVTSATAVIFGQTITDPVEVVGKISGFLPNIGAFVGLTLATISTNIAANVVAPANALVNLAPRQISFTKGAMITALLGIVTQPWRLMSSSEGYIFTWLIGYSALLGPVAGIVMADYFLVRKRTLDVDALYSARGDYWYSNGYNTKAFLAFIIGVLPSLPGFLGMVFKKMTVPKVFETLYSAAWFVGFGVSIVAYLMLYRNTQEA